MLEHKQCSSPKIKKHTVFKGIKDAFRNHIFKIYQHIAIKTIIKIETHLNCACPSFFFYPKIWVTYSA